MDNKRLLFKARVFRSAGWKWHFFFLHSVFDTDLFGSILLKMKALTLETLPPLPSLFLSLHCWFLASPCAVGVVFNLLLLSFFLWRWKLTETSKPLQASFLPLLIDFPLQFLPLYLPLLSNTRTRIHMQIIAGVSLASRPLYSQWLSRKQGPALLEPARGPSLNLPQRSILL